VAVTVGQSIFNAPAASEPLSVPDASETGRRPSPPRHPVATNTPWRLALHPKARQGAVARRHMSSQRPRAFGDAWKGDAVQIAWAVERRRVGTVRAPDLSRA
jgi:hypothetical protein